VLRHVLCSRIERDDADTVRVEGLKCSLPWILIEYEELVVPYVFEPLAQKTLDNSKVEGAPNFVQSVRLDVECDSVVVTVEVATLILVPNYTMPTTDVVVASCLDHSV